MKLRVLGCDGGRGLGYNSTCLLFNDSVMIDAGTIQSELSLDEALKVTDIFFTHCHLDHILDLPFLLDATFEKRKNPLRLHGTAHTLNALMKHIFNDEIWPNFSKLPKDGAGQFTLHTIEAGKTYQAGGLSFTPFDVDHTVPTVGYKIEDGKKSIVFSGDTCPVASVWEMANQAENLSAVILDLSFSNSEQHVANLSKHMTSTDVERELQKLKKDCDVYVFHYKVGLASTLNTQKAHITHFGKPLKALRDYKTLEF